MTDVKAVIGIMLLMWTGNNVTRPFRIAGSAAIAPAVKRLAEGIQRKLKLPTVGYGFGLIVAVAAGAAFAVVGALFLSRMV